MKDFFFIKIGIFILFLTEITTPIKSGKFSLYLSKDMINI